MYHGTIIQIDDCLVSEEILTEYFACDYEKCKGCCCVIGDSGAPMEECEAEAIEKNYHIFSPLMSDEGRAAVAAKGFYEIDMDGDMVTPLVPDSEECAYTLFDEEGNCFCSMERCCSRARETSVSRFHAGCIRSASPSSATSTAGTSATTLLRRVKKKRSAYMNSYANLSNVTSEKTSMKLFLKLLKC